MTRHEHKKLLRAIRHQQRIRENRQTAKKIDRAFSRLTEGCSERVTKAVLFTYVLYRDRQPPDFIKHKKNRAWYNKPRRERGVSCHARQKFNPGSTPLIPNF